MSSRAGTPHPEEELWLERSSTPSSSLEHSRRMGSVAIVDGEGVALDKDQKRLLKGDATGVLQQMNVVSGFASFAEGVRT